MKSLLTIAGLAALLGAGGAALADQRFDFTYSASDPFITGQLTTTDLVGAAYTIIEATGTMDGVRIAGLAPAISFLDSNFPTDNLLYASGALVDTDGLIIDPVGNIAPGPRHAPEKIQDTPFIASAEPGVFFYDTAIAGSAENDQLGSFTVENVTSAVPEPGTVALLGFGLLGVGVMRRRVV